MADTEGVPELNTSLMPVYQEYKSRFGEDTSLWTYLSYRTEPDLAAAFSKLFWPDFVEVEGCILLKEAYHAETFEEWKLKFNGDRIAIETMLNHTHINDLFLNRRNVVANDPFSSDLVDLNQPTKELFSIGLYDYLGKILLVCWKHAVQQAFPGRQFTFHCSKEHEDLAPEITFHQGECPAEEAMVADKVAEGAKTEDELKES